MKENKKTFEEFRKLNDKYIHFEKPNSKYINGRIAIGATIKLLQDHSENKIYHSRKKDLTDVHKFLEEFNESLKKDAEAEIEKISKEIELWLTNLIKRIYIFKEVEADEKRIEDVRTKIMNFLNETQMGLNSEVIYYLVSVFCI